MARSEMNPSPVEGGKSVLSGKEEIRGLPKTGAERDLGRRREAASCESVLAGPECMRGVPGKAKRS